MLLGNLFRQRDGLRRLSRAQVKHHQCGGRLHLSRILLQRGLQFRNGIGGLAAAHHAQAQHRAEFRGIAGLQRLLHVGHRADILPFGHERGTQQDHGLAITRPLEALADELGLPVVIHQRHALAETLAILEEVRPAAGGVLHCFDDGPEVVARAAALGFRLEIGGSLTYGHAPLTEAVHTAPAELLVLETDAPWLEPEPRSLRRNEPGLLPRVVRRLCELRGWTPEEADRVTTANARDLFRLPAA